MDCLEEAYDTEPGHGENRDSYLRVIILYKQSNHTRISSLILYILYTGSWYRDIFDQRTRTMPRSSKITKNTVIETPSMVGREIKFQLKYAKTNITQNG